MELFAFKARHDPGSLAPLALPGVRWTERLSRALGLIGPAWAGARLVSPSLSPQVGVVLVTNQPFTGFRIALACHAVAGEGPPTRWRPVLLDPRGESVGARLRLATGFRELAPGSIVHVQRHGCTFRRVEGAVRCVDLDGFVLVVPDASNGTVELRTSNGQTARARIGEDETLSSLEVHDAFFVSVWDPATALFERLEASFAQSGPAAWAAVTRDDRCLVRRLTHRPGDEHALDYDEAGRLVRLAAPTGDTLTLTYAEPTGLTLARISRSGMGSFALTKTGDASFSAVSASGAPWTCAFAGDGMLVREMRPDAGVSTVERDETNGAATALLGARGELEYFYDLEGFVVCADDARGPRFEFEHDPDGRLTRAVVPGVGQLRRVFDGDGRLVAVSGVEGVWEYRYDADGVRAIGARDEVALTTQRGRVVRVAAGGRSWSLMADDPQHRWLVGSDGQQLYFGRGSGGMERWGAPDLLDLHVQRDLHGRVLAFSAGDESQRGARDPEGALTAIEPGCTIERDADGRVRRVTAGAMVEERRYAHDAIASVSRGGAIVRQDSLGPNGVLRSFSVDLEAVDVHRDATGRIERIETVPATIARTFEHDARGRVALARVGARALTLERIDGRIVREHWEGMDVRVARDERGARVALRTSLGLSVTYQRDGSGRVGAMTCEWADEARHVELRHDAAGREVERRVGPVIIATQRDPIGRPVRRTIAHDGRTVERTEYAWSGRRLASQASSSGQTVTYQYDRQGALVGWSTPTDAGVLPAALAGVEYDERRPVRAGERRHQHARGGHLRAVRGASGTTTYAYDALGALTSVRAPDLEVEYAYDPLQRVRLRSARRYERAPAVRGSWDAPRERAHADESRLTWIWDGPRVVHRTSSRGATFSHVWADGVLVVTLVDDVPYVVAPGPFGDADALVGVGGELAWTRDPATLIVGRPDSGARAFGVPALPDHWFDDDVGLWHSLFRVLDPDTARYLSPNPLGLAVGPSLHSGPADPIRDRMRFGVGRPHEPFWSELATDDFGTLWVELVLDQLTCAPDEQGAGAWRPLDDSVAPDPGRWLLEHAGLIDAREATAAAAGPSMGA